MLLTDETEEDKACSVEYALHPKGQEGGQVCVVALPEAQDENEQNHKQLGAC